MEKKIEHVPYISKWYKEEQKDELLHFAFDEQNAGSDWDVDKIFNYTTTTTCEHCRTSVDNEPQHSVNQKPYGTLGEHWKELMDLFDIKSKYGLESLKEVDENCLITFNKDWYSTNKLHNVFNKLGLDFIKDFIKACEKCED